MKRKASPSLKSPVKSKRSGTKQRDAQPRQTPARKAGATKTRSASSVDVSDLRQKLKFANSRIATLEELLEAQDEELIELREAEEERRQKFRRQVDSHNETLQSVQLRVSSQYEAKIRAREEVIETLRDQIAKLKAAVLRYQSGGDG